MKLELIDKAIKDSLEHGNNATGTPSFTTAQIELLSEAIKVAFEAYHNQIKDVIEDM